MKDDFVRKISGNSKDFDLETAPAEEVVRRTLDEYGDFFGVYLAGLGAPSVDGEILPDLPMHLRPNPNVDVLVGVTSFDQTMPLIPEGRDKFLSTFGLSGNTDIENAYSASDDANLFLDACLRCQAQRLLPSISEVGGAAYWYTYDCPEASATHITEIFATFGRVDQMAFASPMVQELAGPPPSDELIRRVQTAWASFAKTGSPGWDVAALSGTGARIGCNATTIEPLIDEYGTCSVWTSSADALGPLGVGTLCFTDSNQLDETPGLSSGPDWLFLGLVFALVACALFSATSKRRKGYDTLEGSGESGVVSSVL